MIQGGAKPELIAWGASPGDTVMRELWMRAARLGPEPCVICLRPATTKHHVAPRPGRAPQSALLPVVPLCFVCHHELEARLLARFRDARHLLSPSDIQPPRYYSAAHNELRIRRGCAVRGTPNPLEIRAARAKSGTLQRYVRIVRSALRRRRLAARSAALSALSDIDWTRVFREIRAVLEIKRHPMIREHRIAELSARKAKRVNLKGYTFGPCCERCGAPEAALCGVYPRACLTAMRQDGGHLDHASAGLNPFRALCAECLRIRIGQVWPRLSDAFWTDWLAAVAAVEVRPYRVQLAMNIVSRRRAGLPLDEGLRREADSWTLLERRQTVLERYVRRYRRVEEPAVKRERRSKALSALSIRFQEEMAVFRTWIE